MTSNWPRGRDKLPPIKLEIDFWKESRVEGRGIEVEEFSSFVTVFFLFYLALNFVWEGGIVLLVWVCESVILFVCVSVIKITQKVLNRFLWNFAGSFLMIKSRSSSNLRKITLVERKPRPKKLKKRHISKSIESISIKSGRTLCYC